MAIELDDLDKGELISLLMDVKLSDRDRILTAFIPDAPKARPFAEQMRFFKDKLIQNHVRTAVSRMGIDIASSSMQSSKMEDSVDILHY